MIISEEENNDKLFGLKASLWRLKLKLLLLLLNILLLEIFLLFNGKERINWTLDVLLVWDLGKLKLANKLLPLFLDKF